MEIVTYFVIGLLITSLIALALAALNFSRFYSAKNDPVKEKQWIHIAAHAARDGNLNPSEIGVIERSYYSGYLKSTKIWGTIAVAALSSAYASMIWFL
ncbi:hypothetical protein ALP05_200011 [Pseudomonas caricapapayae]|uniref:Uncharacterized protein n=1 Tax=Pseudomonas caricapapayae TaxID=46678 RepID=A0A3M6EXY0_9PSED|nr:hypothetical protein [Pseudomonas caricapapayae]RMV73128.1 hypothetical protein ALP05_200011 [Pseudomonas caricapapayae]